MINILDYIFIIPGLLSAIIPHELAHGYMAYALGDNTAKDAGRLSLNPLKHIDPLGFISLIVLKFGWAKPVPIDPRAFKNRRLGTILVSIAGPITNFILALIFAFILVNLNFKNTTIFMIIRYGLFYNVILGVFNLLPFPPLDGSKIIASSLPLKYEYYFYKYERYFYIVLIALLVTNKVDNIIWPIITNVMNFILNIVYF